MEGGVKSHFPLARCGLAPGVDPLNRQCVELGGIPPRLHYPREFCRGIGGQHSPRSFSELRTTLSSFDDSQAGLFSVAAREPSFHQGLCGPLLRSVLWRGIAYLWGLHPVRTRPGKTRMLTSDLVSPAALMLIVDANKQTDQSTAEAIISCFSLPGSYSFSSFHIRRTMAATCRAIVSLARLGLVPAEVSCR